MTVTAPAHEFSKVTDADPSVTQREKTSERVARHRPIQEKAAAVELPRDLADCILYEFLKTTEAPWKDAVASVMDAWRAE